MKQLLNNGINTLPTVNEVDLFRLMANIFNTNTSKSAFVNEVHGQRGFIDYHSTFSTGLKKIEIADLLMITCNRWSNEIRICFIQAKYRRRNYRRFLTFGANLYQWELLKDKPNIIDNYNKGFPQNILNFSHFESITSFGIFYKDHLGQIDFLYTLPKHIQKRNLNKYQTMDFYAGCHCPNSRCLAGIMPDETISTCSIDIFEREALACRIGAPIDSSVKPYIASLLNSMRRNNLDNGELINEFIGRFDINTNDLNSNYYYPNTILLLTNAEAINNNFG